MIGECRESSEKVAEGLAESEKSRGIQRCLVYHVSSIREVQKKRQDTVIKKCGAVELVVVVEAGNCIAFLIVRL